MIRRLARQALDAFTAWRLARRVAKADPVVADLQRRIAELSRKHRGAAPLRRELRARVIANLAREQGVTPPERLCS